MYQLNLDMLILKKNSKLKHISDIYIGTFVMGLAILVLICKKLVLSAALISQVDVAKGSYNRN